ncbi:extracellular solute-binding protein [Rhizobium sp. WYJ-E13]|uniref:extracellular solute-binding protein n=1 Tax=unclassified Rhizobium TaxID=2613769 RepID=UPI001C1EAA03|nr:extracellular solute-binding protein [Rhizobium sp. WYJ-E13]QWW70564.1 extracellular solute-binding protein [Rhizobium sp. WYJ-E13]
MFRMLKLAKCIVVATALCGSAAHAQETVAWWDFLSGGDGVRMKQMIADFNKAHEGKIKIEATTLEWGTPFYSKVQTAASVGEAPDIMTYHASRIPLAVKQGILQEITADDWSKMGLAKDAYAETTWDAVTIDGKQYAVPFDTHPIVLYYNKDILAKAGLLTEDGKPKGLDSRENFEATLQGLKKAGVKFPLGSVTADGNFMFRTIYSLMGQQDGELLTDGEFLAGDNAQKLQNALALLQGWTKEDLQSTYTDYPATVALFTSGEAAMMINGVWEVPTMVDLHKQGKLFEWGAVELPVLFKHASTYADSHTFAIPANKGKDMTADKRAAVLEVISWLSKNSLYWASAGHIPAYGPVTQSAEYKAMQPNATYSPLTANMIFDPKTPLAGVAGPIFDVMSNYFVPTLNNEMDPAKAVEEIKTELNDL